VAPLLLAVAGLLALGVGAAILRSFGSAYQIGRLLAAAPRVSVAEARALAQAGTKRYVRVEGRIDSDEEFEDADHRPLVLRRTRLQSRASGGGRSWTTFESSVEAVPFVIRDGLDELDVDGRDLDEGLVVVPRESIGVIADLADRAPAGSDASSPARAVIEQVSSVEHATVLGVPVRDGSGRARMTAGMGRPLILTTLEQAEAMRVLTVGASGRSRLAAITLAIGVVLLAGAAALWALTWLGVVTPTALAASPAPSFGVGSDTRSPGQGPGLVGDPVFAVLAVLGIAILSGLASLVYARRTGSREAPPPRSR
jgi:hypothetical protein